MSARRRREMKEYGAKRKEFLELHPYCMATIKVLGLNEGDVVNGNGWGTDSSATKHRVPAATDIHHVHGRYGGNYLNPDTWLAVCRQMHETIHERPSWARSIGLLH